jgi:hypothetical protein
VQPGWSCNGQEQQHSGDATQHLEQFLESLVGQWRLTAIALDERCRIIQGVTHRVCDLHVMTTSQLDVPSRNCANFSRCRQCVWDLTLHLNASLLSCFLHRGVPIQRIWFRVVLEAQPCHSPLLHTLWQNLRGVAAQHDQPGAAHLQAAWKMQCCIGDAWAVSLLEQQNGIEALQVRQRSECTRSTSCTSCPSLSGCPAETAGG